MKIMMLLTLLQLFLVLACGAARAEDQRGTAPRFSEAKSIVDGIDRDLRSLKSYSQTFETGTDRGGKVTIYRQDSGVVRIDLTVGLSKADRRDIFYYSHGNLLFVRSKKVRYPYSESKGFDFQRPETVFQSQYYAVGNELTPVGKSKKLDIADVFSLIRDADYLMRAVENHQRIDGERLMK
jgi:outer membrane lipoprotein-sorting protein